MQLSDPCGDISEEDKEDEEENYTYTVLCESDDEADQAQGGAHGGGREHGSHWQDAR